MMDEFTLGIIGVALILGLCFAGLVCWIFWHQMKTARIRTEANEYVEAGSFELTQSFDTHLGTNVTRVPLNTGNDRPGGPPRF